MAATYNAWRFFHPDLDRSRSAPGLRISPRGAIEMVSEHESVRQSILLLLSTVPGERVMRPEYGCDLFRLVFSPRDETTCGLAIHFVRLALERWEPRIDIVRLDAIHSPGAPGVLMIELEYRTKLTLHTDRLHFGLSLSGEPLA